jgi:hypothetical protein
MTRFIFIVVLVALRHDSVSAQTNPPIFKVEGKLSFQNFATDSPELSPPNSTDVIVVTDGTKWKIAMAASKYSAPAEILFDGTDTFRYHIARDFLPGHKLPGDEKIAYTCSIEPGNFFPRRFWTDRLLAMVFLSGNLHRTAHTLPPIETNQSVSPTRDFTTTGDPLNAVLKATFPPSITGKRLAENIPFSTAAEVTVTKTKQISGVAIPETFVWKFYSPWPLGSPTNVITTAVYNFEATNISVASPRDFSYPTPNGIGSIEDLRMKETSRNNVQWLATGARGKVSYQWHDAELPKRDTSNLLQRIPPLIYRGLVLEKHGLLTRVAEDDPRIPRP